MYNTPKGTGTLIAFLFLFTHAFAATSAPKEQRVIIIAGPSCSGKSTLSEQVHKKLGDQWEFVGLDEIDAEQEKLAEQTKSPAPSSKEIFSDYLPAAINAALGRKKSVIVDTNMYHESLAQKLSCKNITTILIYAPLPTLIERDNKRQQDRIKKFPTRWKQRNRRARAYVMVSFSNFFTFENQGCSPINQLDADSLNSSWQEALFYRGKIFYKKLFDHKKTIPFFPRFSCDLCLNTNQDNIETCVEKILAVNTPIFPL